MLIVMKPTAVDSDIRTVQERVEQLGFFAKVLPGAQRTAVAITGNPGPVPSDYFACLKGVKEVVSNSNVSFLRPRMVIVNGTTIDDAWESCHPISECRRRW